VDHDVAAEFGVVVGLAALSVAGVGAGEAQGEVEAAVEV